MLVIWTARTDATSRQIKIFFDAIVNGEQRWLEWSFGLLRMSTKLHNLGNGESCWKSPVFISLHTRPVISICYIILHVLDFSTIRFKYLVIVGSIQNLIDDFYTKGFSERHDFQEYILMFKILICLDG